MLDGLLGSLGGAAGVAAFVIGAFWKYEDVASPEAKLKVTQWLRYSGPKTGEPGWAQHLVVAFNKIFGERHFSFKCIWRSCMASTIAVVLVSFAWIITRPDEFNSMVTGEKYSLAAKIVGVAVTMATLNWVPDYFSYMKTRSNIEENKQSTRRFRSFSICVC
jgi:hypothetical protein